LAPNVSPVSAPFPAASPVSPTLSRTISSRSTSSPGLSSSEENSLLFSITVRTASRAVEAPSVAGSPLRWNSTRSETGFGAGREQISSMGYLPS
jgi:hypothetical protein